MRRYREIGPDRRVVAFFQNIFVVSAKILAHDLKREALVLLRARRAFDVGSEKTPHRILVAAQEPSRRQHAVDMVLGIELAHVEEQFEFQFARLQCSRRR